MKNPFPGMNPYLELRWHDVHTRLMVYICDAVNFRLPRGLVARVEEEVRIDVDGGNKERFRPDVEVSANPAAAETRQSAAAVLTADEPAADPCFVLSADPPTPRHVAIYDSRDWSVVTSIELLSPSNKVSARGRDLYEAKQTAYLNAGVNLVEIDLIRDGQYVSSAPLECIPPSNRGTYMICVYRAARPSQWEYYPVQLRDRLPSIRIPLRPSDADVVLPLQRLIDEACERGQYNEDDYALRLEPSLATEDAAWSESLLRESGLRK